MQAIQTKYLGPTSTHGARVKASNDGSSVTVPWADSLGTFQNHERAAYVLWDAIKQSHEERGGTFLSREEWELIGGSVKNGYVFCFRKLNWGRSYEHNKSAYTTS